MRRLRSSLWSSRMLLPVSIPLRTDCGSGVKSLVSAYDDGKSGLGVRDEKSDIL